MLLWLLRIIFLFTMMGIGTALSLTLSQEAASFGIHSAVVPVAVFMCMTLLGAGIIVLDMTARHKQITTMSAVYFGLLLGLLFGHLLSSAIMPVVKPPELQGIWPYEAPLHVLITTVCCYVCVSTLVQTKDDFRFLIPYIEFNKQVKGTKSLVLDTSVIIDGRIADICDTRIIDTKLVVPRFVLQELQNIADSADKLKRNRGRRGLDVLKRMQNNTKVELVIHEADLPELREIREVDQRLVVMAKALGARVVTNDFNLNKISQLQGVEVINLNELANAMKSVALPGEAMTVRLMKPGDQVGQGVGYLDDGTMVVAEQGRNYIGQEVHLTVTSVLQTPAGRMIFGKVDGKPGSHQSNQQKPAADSV